MARKDGGDKRTSRAEAVRAAAEQAFATGQAQLAQVGRERDRAQERAQSLFDELAQVATRGREIVEELRPSTAEELRALREQVAALERRVAELEKAPAGKRAPAGGKTAGKAAKRAPRGSRGGSSS